MSDPFEIVADAEEKRLREASPLAPAGGDSYEAVADSEAQARTTALSNTLRQAISLNPDKVATERALARENNLPVPTVQRNADLVTQATRVRELLDLAKDSPILGRQLLNPDFAAIAHDDADKLGVVEKTVGALNRGLSAVVAGAGPRSAANLWGVVRAGAETASKLTGGRFGEGIAYRAQTEAAKLGRMADTIRGGEDKPGFVESSIYAGLESLGANLITVPLGVFARSANASLVPMLAMAGGGEYTKAREKDLNVGASFNYAVRQATIEYFTEKLPMNRLLGDLKAGTPFWKTVLHQAALEVPGEQVATLLQDLTEWSALKPGATFKQYLDERPSAAAQTLIATLVSVGGQTAVAAGAENVVRRLTGDAERAQSAEENAAVFAELQKLAAASKLRERDPQTFGEFVQAAADEGPVDALWVGGRELVQVLEQTGTDATILPASVREQLADAAVSGGDVRIPLGDFATAEEKLGQALLPHLKTSPEAFSQAEAQVFMQGQAEQFKAEAEQILAASANHAELQLQVEQVRQHFAEQLAQANRFTPDVNTAYSTLVSNLYMTMAHRLGITPVEMLARYPLRVAAENVAGDVVMDQAKTRTPEFKTPERLQAEAVLSAKHPALPGGAVTGPQWLQALDVAGVQLPPGAREKVAAANEPMYRDQMVRTFYQPEGWDTAETGDPSSPDALKPGRGSRGMISLPNDITASPSTITLLKNADLSTFLHELGHFQLEVMANIVNSPNPPAAIVNDFNALLAWFGVPDSATWQTMSLEEKRPHHEKFARGFEAYLFEGRSPNVELNGIFARFAAWLKHVYQSLKALNVELTDEVRGVMDRMVASEAAIATAEAARGYAPAFATKPDNMTASEWQAYQELGAEATETATDDLQRRSLRDMRWASNARSRALSKLQAEANAKRKAIREEVSAEVKAEPAFAVQEFIKNGTLPDGTQAVGAKMSMAALKEMYGEDPAAPWRYLATNLVSTDKDGSLHPDVLAEMFGFTSGDHMVRAILEAGTANTIIDGLTDQRMLERYGDMSDEAAIERAADEAVHNEARGRFVATELKALSKATGQARVMTSAAKAFAEATIRRKTVRDIRPGQYAAAEARAARAATAALAKNNLVEAATEKRNQLINHHATRAAYEAQEYVEKALRKLKKLAGNEGTRKNLDPEYIEQIDQLLERFDLKSASGKEIARRASLREWADSQRELGLEPDIDENLLAEANRQHYSTLTLEEFRGLVDAVRNIEHLGRLKKKLLTARDDKEFAAVVDDLSNSVRDNATGTVTERRASDRGPLVSIGKLFRRFLVEHRKFASLAREMDGWKDAGPMWERLVRTMNDAGNFEAVEREKATIALTELLAPILKGPKLGTKTLTPAVGKSFTREERIGIALNTGNETNLERVLTGEKWSKTQLAAVLDPLTQEDWAFVQAVWDYIGSFRQAIGEKQKRITGFAPEWVEGTPVQTKYGVLAGGYYPIKYDAERSTRSEADTAAEVQRQIERGLYTRAQTRRGHTKERVESTGRPMRYDLGVITQHVDQVIHDLAWHEFLIDANRLLNAKPLDGAIREHYGPEKLGTMRDMLRDIAVGDLAAQTAGDRILNYLRHGATIAGLGWNVATSLLQPVGITQSIVRIGTRNVLRGLRHWAGDAASLESSAAKIAEKSDFMRLRAKTMQREINEIRNKVSGKDSVIEASYFYLIQKMQSLVDIPTWWGAYEKAMHENGMNESKAIALADQAVIDAQGAGQIKDLAQVQRGSPAWRLFTNFYSFFSTTYNLTRESVGRTNFRSVPSMAALVADMALLYTIPALLSTLIKAGLSGDWDDEEKLARRLIADQINYLLGTVVVLREVGGAVQGAAGLRGADYSGPASVRFFAEIAKLAKQAEQGEADAAFWKALNASAGIVFHYPAGQINKTAEGISQLATGQTQNPLAAVGGKQH